MNGDSPESQLGERPFRRVQVVGVQRGKKRILQRKHAEKELAISRLSIKPGLATVRSKCTSLLGRLEQLGPGVWAAHQERMWGLEQQAAGLARSNS